MTLQEAIARYTQEWEVLHKWVMPDIQDSVSFMVTEATEALDQVLRHKTYVRNHPEETSPWDRLKEEIADTVLMAMVTANVMGFDLYQAVLDKLRRMDDGKRNA